MICACAPLFAVAACWWARTEVLSIIWMSPWCAAVMACIIRSHNTACGNCTKRLEKVVRGPNRKITPRRAGSQHPKNAVQHAAIIDARHSARLVGQKRRDHAPFEVGQVISAYAYAESDFACHANPIYGFTA